MSLIIGICGGSGSGKTSFLNLIKQKVKNVSYMSYDSYYKDCSHLVLEERNKLNFDCPTQLDEEEFIKDVLLLKQGLSVDIPIYDFSTHTRCRETQRIESCKVIIIEGILIYSSQKLRDLFDLKIFIDAAENVRLNRRIRRDCIERGRTEESVREQFTNTVKPMHDLYVDSSKEMADVIIPNNGESGFNSLVVDCIVKYIQSKAK